jgi:hypothetical protein
MLLRPHPDGRGFFFATFLFIHRRYFLDCAIPHASLFLTLRTLPLPFAWKSDGGGFYFNQFF